MLVARAVAAAWVVTLAGSLSACRDDESPQPSSTDGAAVERPAPVDVCVDAGPGWRALDAPADGRGVRAAAMGRGPAVVFLNQSDNDPCIWMAWARRMASRGRSAAVFAYKSVDADHERDAARDALAVAAAATATGRYVLIGASLGGRVVFVAAAGTPRGLGGIVSLSGERRVRDYVDILPVVRRVTAPVLYLGSREDPLTEGARQPRQLRAALRSPAARFMLFPGFDHGVELLEGPNGRRVARAVEQFVDRHAR